MRFPQPNWQTFFAHKIHSQESLIKLISPLRQQGKTVATINGSFDLLHAGHMFMIYEASKTADILVIALNSDASIKRYKSPSRPIIGLQHRMEMIAALAVVDYVTWF